jgi:hypothetical protein
VSQRDITGPPKQSADLLEQGLHLRRLDDDGVGLDVTSKASRACGPGIVWIRCQHDHRDPTRRRIGLELRQQREPIEPGHDAVGHDEIGRRLPDPFQSFSPIPSRSHLVVVRFECGPQKAQHRGTVVNHEHARAENLFCQGGLNDSRPWTSWLV